jgi:hypothetical protein
MHPPESENEFNLKGNVLHPIKSSDRLGVLTRSMARRSSSISSSSENILLKEEDSQDKLLITQLVEEFKSQFIDPEDIDISFSNFPYYIRFV